jgi:hypothetical protein
MAIEEGPLMTETLQEPPKPESQPPAAESGQPASLPELDDAAVREAIARAEAQGQSPESLTVSDLSQGKPQEPAPQAQKADAPKTDVPEKFLKPDGEVDVEKLQASTKQLDEAIQKKEVNLDAAIEKMLTDYREKERTYKGMPNPARLSAQTASQPESPVVPDVDLQRIEQRLLADFQQNPLATIDTWVDIKVKEKLRPLEEKERDNGIRGNLMAIAKEDPRVIAHVADIRAEFDREPELLQLKNPHKVAWLQVKERLRLGEQPKGVQAQPSKPLSPVLGGGTPPPPPSSSASPGVRAVDQLGQLDLKDKRQEAMGDEYIRALLSKERRF